MRIDPVRTSKFLSLVLRHKPEEIGLTLDENGWAGVDELIRLATRAGHKLNRPLLALVVEQNDKQRFAFSDDGLRIRASQGHSVAVDLGLAPSEPPEALYHGTALRFLPSIRVGGLTRGNRRHVHLSKDAETAASVGRRHGQTHVLTVRAGEMHRAGLLFYLSDNGVWLTEGVPVAYIDGL